MLEVRQRTTVRTLQKGEVLLRIGEPVSHAFLVGNGVLRVARAAGAGLETTGFLQSDDWLMYCFDSEPATSMLEVSAACTTAVYAIPHDVAFRGVASTPEVALLALELTLARHARQYAQIYVSSGQVSPRRAVGLALADLAHRRAGARPFVEKVISQEMLADFTNLSREAVNRAIREFRDTGWVIKTELGLELTAEFEDILRRAEPLPPAAPAAPTATATPATPKAPATPGALAASATALPMCAAATPSSCRAAENSPGTCRVGESGPGACGAGERPAADQALEGAPCR